MAKIKQTATKKNLSDFFPQEVSADADGNGVKKWNRLTAGERSKVKMAGVNFASRNLSGINLNGVTADGASFAGSALADAKLAGSFHKATFAGATLTRAKLASGFFDGVDFSSAEMSGADLSSGDFCRAKFCSANLTAASFSECYLLGADLTGANLTGAVFSAARFDKDSKWPAGFFPPGEMTWCGRGTDPRLSGKGKKAVAQDINGLMARLHQIIDPGRMKRVLDMLRKEKQQLFHEIEPAVIRGIVRSQKEADLIYSCVLTEKGDYSCATPDVAPCMGLSNEPCKHILVLVIGLARANLIDPATVDRWLVAAKAKGPRWNKTVKNHVSDSLLKYKGVEAGEVDWRPTETIPEDYYAM